MKHNCFLDPKQPVYIHWSGLLPHWEQEDKLQFVTFRLYDSLPQEKICELEQIREKFKEQHPQPWDIPTSRLYSKVISHREEELLDNGYGSCILRREDLRKVVSDSIKHLTSKFYDLIAFVIMPNHVHMIVCIKDGNDLRSVICSLKGYTARQINKLLNRKGPLWMKEYYDRLIRSKQHLMSCINYIYMNPRHLATDDYELYIDENII